MKLQQCEDDRVGDWQYSISNYSNSLIVLLLNRQILLIKSDMDRDQLLDLPDEHLHD